MLKKIKKLLRKLSLFDKFLIAIAIIGLATFVYIFFRKSSYLTVTLRVGEDGIYYPSWGSTVPSVQQIIHKGMVEKDGLGRNMAEVIDINSYYLVPERVTLYITTKLKTTYSRSNNQYSYKGTPVLVGSTVNLYLDNISVNALVTKIEGFNDFTEKKTLIVEGQLINQNSTFLETSGTDKYLADAIHIGDTAEDSQGMVTVKVLDKIVKPAIKTTNTADGRILTQTDPIRKDVFLKMEVNAEVIQGKYFIFEDIPVLIGQGIPVCTSTMCYYPTVTSISNDAPTK